METVPVFDSSRYASVPEPTSSARSLKPNDSSSSVPFGFQHLQEDDVEWQTLPGQKLTGEMIPFVSSEIDNKVKTT